MSFYSQLKFNNNKITTKYQIFIPDKLLLIGLIPGSVLLLLTPDNYFWLVFFLLGEFSENFRNIIKFISACQAMKY